MLRAITLLALLALAQCRTLPPLGNACRSSGPATADLVCDPDALLSSAQALSLNALARRVHFEAPHSCGEGFQLAIALVRRLEPGDSIGALARAAHDAWGVGRAACQDGLVLALALEDRELHISTGRGTKALLTDQGTAVVLERMHPLLREGALSAALEHATLDLLSVLQAGAAAGSGKSLPPSHDSQRARAILRAAAAMASAEWWAVALQLAVFALVVAAVAYSFWLHSKERAREAAQARVAERLRAVQRARAEAEASPPEDDTPLASRISCVPGAVIHTRARALARGSHAHTLHAPHTPPPACALFVSMTFPRPCPRARP